VVEEEEEEEKGEKNAIDRSIDLPTERMDRSQKTTTTQPQFGSALTLIQIRCFKLPPDFYSRRP
jgi:hypothetical protein